MGLNSKNVKNADLTTYLSNIDNDLATGKIMDKALIHIEEFHHDINIIELEERASTEVKNASSFYYEIPITELIEDVIKYEKEFIAQILADDLDNDDFIISKEYKQEIGYGYFQGEFHQCNIASVVMTQDGNKVRVKTAYPEAAYPEI